MIKPLFSRSRGEIDRRTGFSTGAASGRSTTTTECDQLSLKAPGRLKQLDPQQMAQQSGQCISVPLREMPSGDSVDCPGASMLRLFEDGVELGPAHSSHVEIERRGTGRFSHWSGQLYFSSSDGSSPLSNGRRYQALWDGSHAPNDGYPVCSLPLGALLNLQRGIMSYQYRGIDCFKCPFDIALYQRLFWEIRPRTIIEIGSWKGGSALWFADLLTTYGVDGHIHSFDIAEPPSWTDPRISFHRADAHTIADSAPATWVGQLPRPLVVIEDAGHMCSMTAAVLKHFGPLMRSGEYIIVEDAIVHEMNHDKQYDGGPRRAIREFLEGNNEYLIDRDYCDYYGQNVTWNVNGYLRRV